MNALIYVFSFQHVGVFLSNDLWHNELLKGKRFEFKIWPLPSSEIVKTKKVVQLLNELPLPKSRQNASVELRTDSMNHSTQFQSALKAENLCFKSFPASADKIIVYVGNAEYMKSVKFEANKSLIIVPFTAKDLVMSGKNQNYKVSRFKNLLVNSKFKFFHNTNFSSSFRHSQQFLHCLRV